MDQPQRQLTDQQAHPLSTRHLTQGHAAHNQGHRLGAADAALTGDHWQKDRQGHHPRNSGFKEANHHRRQKCRGQVDIQPRQPTSKRIGQRPRDSLAAHAGNPEHILGCFFDDHVYQIIVHDHPGESALRVQHRQQV